MKTSILTTLLSLGLLASAASPSFAQTAEDTDRFGFEDGQQPFLLVTFDGTPAAGSLALTEDPAHVHDGTKSLEFQYERMVGSPQAIVLPVMLTDLTAVRMWVLSEKDATWVLGHEDRDGASFFSTVALPAGQWTSIDLSPADFELGEDSDVYKPAMEPERNGVYLLALDLNTITGPAGPNTVWVDTVEVERPPLALISGETIVNPGELLLITQPTKIDGDLKVFSGGFVHSTTTRLVLTGNLYVLGAQSEARFENGTLRFPQQYRYQQEIIAALGGDVIFDELLFHSPYWISMAITRMGIFEARHTVFAGGSITGSAMDGGRIELHHAENPGEFLIYPRSELVASSLNQLILWLIATEETQAVFDLPEWHDVTWEVPVDWNRRISLTDIKQLWPSLIAYEGCDVLVRNGRLRVAGIVFETEDVDLDGYRNRTSYPAQTFDWPRHDVRFENVDLDTWNFYAFDDTEVAIRNSLFGEALAFGQGTVRIHDSVCDGSGGYIGAREDGRIFVFDSELRCNIVCDGNGVLAMVDGEVTGNVTAAENALIGFLRTTVLGSVLELDNGQVIFR